MPYALIAPITSVPSRPRLMRPLRSVMHSPRLTNRNGVETRMAPPNTASGTVQSPIDPSAMSGFPFQKADPSVDGIARQHKHEDDSLQHLHRGVGQAEPSLQQASARADAAEQDRDRNDRKRILPRQERDQDSSEAVAGGKVGVGAALDGGDLDHSGKPGASACDKADGQDQFADGEADDLGGADIAAGDARGEAEGG